MIEIANDLDALSIGGPECEIHPLLVLNFAKMRAEFLVEFPMVPRTE